MHDPNSGLKEQFVSLFGPTTVDTKTGRPAARLHVVRAPGRVNLIGEHTDYNDGFVFPMAIEPEVKVICRTRNDGVVRLASTAYGGQMVELSVEKKIERGDPSWANYSRGVAAQFIAAGIPLSGMDALIANTLPIGGGLSSSAAVEVATAQSFLTLAGLKMDPGRLAMLCQKAEHDFALAPVGIMDMTTVISAQPGHAMLLDCRSLSKQFIPLDPKELGVVIVNSMVKHNLSTSEYGVRRKQCEEGAAILKQDHPAIKALRDVTLKQLETAQGQLSETVYRRCRHVITENQRTADAAAFLLKKQYEQAGALMKQSHDSLKNDYEVSCPELDFLVDQTKAVKGVYGARMTGGGFGGCIVALVQPGAVEALAAHLTHAYASAFKTTPTIIVTPPAAGASVIE